MEHSMNKPLLIAALFTCGLLSGCSIQPIRTFESPTIVNLSELIDSGEYRLKSDIFYSVLDASSSMAEPYLGINYPGDSTATKYSIEKLILRRMNKSAAKLNIGSGIRTFGMAPCLPLDSTVLIYGSNLHNAETYKKSLGKSECVSGGSPVAKALSRAENDLASSTGNIAVVLLSDGYDFISSPVPAVQSLKAKYGDRLCLYTVWVGNKKETSGQAALAQLVDIAGCGFASNAEDIASEPKFNQFVKDVFLTKDLPPVAEPAPAPYTPPAPLADSDQDGTPDKEDKCKDTPRGAYVNKVGCWILEGVNFDFDKSNIKPKYYPKLNNAVDVIRQHPGLKIEIQGHTDNYGTPEYNRKLSDRRAKAVRQYLAPKVGKTAKLTSKGYGEAKPIDTNKTSAGRANNRRVQLDVID
jgi:OmpA-OmpF porin, OOP family